MGPRENYADLVLRGTRKLETLGIHTAAGRGNLHGGQRARMNAIAKKAKRLLRFRKAGAKLRPVAEPGLVPGTAYGCRVIGMVPSVLHRLRKTMTLALPERAKSASITLQFLTSDRPRLDPTFGAWATPVEF